MKDPKKKQAIAGFHLLMILTVVDGKFNAKEDMVVKDWILKKVSADANLDKEIEILSTLREEDYMNHFTGQMDEFYKNSTDHERNELLQFALNIVKADKKITRQENIYLDELFNDWTELGS